MPSSAVGLQKNGYADHLRNGESKIKPYSTVDKGLPLVYEFPNFPYVFTKPYKPQCRVTCA